MRRPPMEVAVVVVVVVVRAPSPIALERAPSLNLTVERVPNPLLVDITRKV